MIMMCLINLILCEHRVDGCHERTQQYPANCKVLSEDDRQYKVNCNDYIKWKYKLADNKLNFVPQWVNKDLCDNRLLED